VGRRTAKGIFVKSNSKIRKIAFVGNHLPRKSGIARFTSDLLAAVASTINVGAALDNRK
jgi:hypothetical protein